jgi:hypothetical protein
MIGRLMKGSSWYTGNWQGKPKCWEKPTSVLLFAVKIPHDLNWDLAEVAVMVRRQLSPQ